MSKPKTVTITFKADETLALTLRGVPNRSEFIRNAVLAAMDNACPLCRGTGILPPTEHNHWRRFLEGHRLTECVECHESYWVCASRGAGDKSERA